MNYLDYIAIYTDVVMHTYIRYTDYANYILYIEPERSLEAIKELQSYAQFVFSVNHLKRLLLQDGLERLEERIEIMGWEMSDSNYRCLLQLNQSESDFYEERMDFFKKNLGDKIGQEYAERLYQTLKAISWNTSKIIEMRNKLLSYRNQKNGEQTNSEDNKKDEWPKILNNMDIRENFDKAIKIGILENYYTLKGSIMLLSCFCWGICKQYNISEKAKSGRNKGGFAAKWKVFSFIKDKKGREIDLKQGWNNSISKNYNPVKLEGFAFWETLCNALENKKETYKKP